MTSKRELEGLYISGLTQQEVGSRYGVTQKVVFTWFKKLGIKSRKAAKRNQWGERNASWKGESASYQALHHWIEKQCGKPQKCSQCGSAEETVFDWANIGHTYKRNIHDWVRLCRRCHRKLDKLYHSESSNSSLVSADLD